MHVSHLLLGFTLHNYYRTQNDLAQTHPSGVVIWSAVLEETKNLLNRMCLRSVTQYQSLGRARYVMANSSII
jgi:hypothetical protein